MNRFAALRFTPSCNGKLRLMRENLRRSQSRSVRVIVDTGNQALAFAGPRLRRIWLQIARAMLFDKLFFPSVSYFTHCEGPL